MTKKNCPDSDIVRKAGPLERYHIARHALGFDACVVVSAQYHYVSPSSPTHTAAERTLGRRTLYPALRRLIQAHGALCVRLTPDSKAFVRLHQVDLDKIVEYHASGDNDDSDAELQQIFESVTSTPGPIDTKDTSIPLWRVIVMKDDTVVFVYHHGIGDGLSGMAFHLNLLEALNQVADREGATDGKVEVPKTIHLLPPIELSIRVPASPKALLLHFVDSNSAASSWTGNPIIPSLRFSSSPNKKSPNNDKKPRVPNKACVKSNVRLISFTPSEITQLTRLCKEHKTTLTVIFHHIAASVISSFLSSQDDASASSKPEYKTLPSVIAMSLRPLTSTPATAFCVYVSAYAFPYPVHATRLPLSSNPPSSPQTPTPTWSPTLSSLSAKIRAHRPKSLEEVGLLKFVDLIGTYEAHFKQRMGKKRDSGLCVSNLGAWPSYPYDKSAHGRGITEGWVIGKTTFTQSDLVVGAALKLSVVGQPAPASVSESGKKDEKGGVRVSVTWGEGNVDNALAEAFTKGFAEGVRELVTIGVSN